VLLSIIILGLTNIDLFSRSHVISSDRRAKIDNEISLALVHMAKNIGKAIGDVNQAPVTLTTIGGDNAITVWIDYNTNGQRDASDKQIAYRYSPAPNYEIWYYSNYTDSPASYEVLTSKKIRPDFSSTTSQPTYRTYSSSNNYIVVQLTACWDPSQTRYSCDTPNNPSVTMKANIKMPSVTTN
jgi:hypothetical protein